MSLCLQYTLAHYFCTCCCGLLSYNDADKRKKSNNQLLFLEMLYSVKKLFLFTNITLWTIFFINVNKSQSMQSIENKMYCDDVLIRKTFNVSPDPQ
jgi:hypothetical protein